MRGFFMSYAITNEIIDLNHQIEIIKQKRHNMRVYEEQLIHHKSIEHFYDCLEVLRPEDNFLISKIYGKGRDTASSLNSIIFESTDPTSTPTLKQLINHLSANLEYHKNICEETYKAVEQRIHELEFYQWSVIEMINISKNICADIDQISGTLNLLKQTKTYRLQTGTLHMDDIDATMKPNTTIQNNYNAPIQQSMIQSGHSNTMTVNQINNQTLQHVCNQIREVINNSQEPDPIKQTLNTDINNFENAQGSTERKSAFESFLSKSASIATLWSSLAPYIPELTKYIG